MIKLMVSVVGGVVVYFLLSLLSPPFTLYIFIIINSACLFN
jgi:hypothetical protein